MSPIARHPDHLEVSLQASDRRHVIALEGELDMASAPFLTSAFDSVLAHAHAVVLDLDRLSFIDSSGLVAILACKEKCREHGVRFAATDGSPQVRRVFDITGVRPALPPVRRFDRPRRRSAAARRHLEASVLAEARRLRSSRHAPPQAL